MKFCWCLFLNFVLWTQALAGLNAPVRFSEQNASLRGILRTLADQTGAAFIFEDDLIDHRCVTEFIQDESLLSVLPKILAPHGLCFVSDTSGNIVIFRKHISPVTLKGVVSDMVTGAPIAMVNVFLNHTGLGSATDRSGFFTIPNVRPGRYELVVQHIGYTPRSYVVGIDGSTPLPYRIDLMPRILQGQAVRVTAREKHVHRDKQGAAWPDLETAYKANKLGLGLAFESFRIRDGLNYTKNHPAVYAIFYHEREKTTHLLQCSAGRGTLEAANTERECRWRFMHLNYTLLLRDPHIQGSLASMRPGLSWETDYASGEFVPPVRTERFISILSGRCQIQMRRMWFGSLQLRLSLPLLAYVHMNPDAVRKNVLYNTLQKKGDCGSWLTPLEFTRFKVEILITGIQLASVESRIRVALAYYDHNGYDPYRTFSMTIANEFLWTF